MRGDNTRAIDKEMYNLTLSLDFIVSEIKYNWKTLSRKITLFDLCFRKTNDSSMDDVLYGVKREGGEISQEVVYVVQVVHYGGLVYNCTAEMLRNGPFRNVFERDTASNVY